MTTLSASELDQRIVQTLKSRAERLTKIRKDPKCLPGLRKYYQDNPIQFINDWGCTFDPRNKDIGLPSTIPFTLFKRQEEWLEFTLERWRARESYLTEKTREMGLSWLAVALSTTLCLFNEGIVIGFGSRKEELVDKLDSPKSLFWKARFFIEHLPPEFRPSSWEAPFMRIAIKDTGSYMTGEAGDNIGRGDRTSIYFADEFAFMPSQKNVDAALSQTSNCVGYISTPNGNGNVFYQKRHSGKVPVFTFHWKDDPRKDEVWYQKQKNTLDPVVLAQEVDIDYNASTSDAYIDGAMVEEAQQTPIHKIEPLGKLEIGIDTAHFGDDESVISPRIGRIAFDQIIKRKADGHELAGEVIEYCDSSVYEVHKIIIELDGPGVSCFDTLRKSKYKKHVIGVHTGARLKDGRNYNKRARMYRKAKEWLDAQPCRLPSDKELKSQAGSTKYGYKDGMLLLESKKDMKKRGVSSPDRWDAFCLSFCEDELIISTEREQVPQVTGWMG